jgi:hypothetical protein
LAGFPLYDDRPGPYHAAGDVLFNADGKLLHGLFEFAEPADFNEL